MEEKVKKVVEIVKNQIREKMIQEAEEKKSQKIFFMSDSHFGDSRLNLYGRDILFKNSKEVDEHIVKRCNETIPEDGILYHLGDVAMTLEDLENINKIHCKKKILIKGNYDISAKNGGTAKFDIDDKVLLKYFDEVYDELELEIGGEKVYLNHYPINAKEDVFNITAHVHNIWRIGRNSVNVGVDCSHFTPVSEEQIKFQINGIKNHYDENCFPNELVSSVKNRIGKVKILIAPEYNKTATFEENKDIYCFMAGPAQGCEDWQSEFIKELQNKLKDIKTNKDIVLCSPRRLEKPKDFVYEEQIDWECYHLEKAAKQGIVIFWFAKETEKIQGRSFARTSRFEMGEWFSKGQTIPEFKMIVGRENGFEGFEYIENRLKSVDEKFVPNTSKKEMIEEIVETIKKMI